MLEINILDELAENRNKSNQKSTVAKRIVIPLTEEEYQNAMRGAYISKCYRLSHFLKMKLRENKVI